MKARFLPTLMIIACLVASASATLPRRALPSTTSVRIAGDYVEARTASVFAGACHYNGELVTTGRDAIMAWNFSAGTYQGVNLAGVRAMAAVSSEANLGDETAARKSELTVDSHATEQQVSALLALLKFKCGHELGQIVSIHRAPVSFAHNESGYSVTAAGFASLAVNYRADDSCCTQPHLVWYSPLSPLDHRKVGYTEAASYTGTVGEHWQRSDEDSAFYGAFTF